MADTGVQSVFTSSSALAMANKAGALPRQPPLPCAARPGCGEWSAVAEEDHLDATQRAGHSEFLEKARAPMATEEFERMLRSEREYWSSWYFQEVKALEKEVKSSERVVCRLQEEAAADRAESEAARASLRDLRAEGECNAATSAARLALLEASMQEMREAVQVEREQRKSESQRHHVELAAVREAHDVALAHVQRQSDISHVDKAIMALQADVARLQSSFAEQSSTRHVDQAIAALQADVAQLQSSSAEQSSTRHVDKTIAALQADVAQLQSSSVEQSSIGHIDEAIAALQADVAHLQSSSAEQSGASHVDKTIAALQADLAQLQSSSAEQESLRRAAELSSMLEQMRSSVDLAHERISELFQSQTQAHDRIAALDDTQARALAAQGSIRAAVAEGSRQSKGDIERTLEVVEELQVEVQRLTESSREHQKALMISELDQTRFSNNEASVRLAVESTDGSGCSEREHRPAAASWPQEELIASLRAEVQWLKAHSTEQGRREELSAQKTAQGIKELADRVETLKAELQKTERRLEEIAESRDADSAPDLRAAVSDALIGSLQSQVKELSALFGGHDSASARRAGDVDQSQPDSLCRQSSLPEEASPEPTLRMRDGLPTLLGRRPHSAPRSSRAPSPGAKMPGSACSDAKARVAGVPSDLKDSLEGIIAAVKKVLEEEPSMRAPVPVVARAVGGGSSVVTAASSVATAAAQPAGMAAPPAPPPTTWRMQRPGGVAVAQVVLPIAQPPVAMRAVGRRSQAGSMAVSPGTPLIIRR